MRPVPLRSKDLQSRLDSETAVAENTKRRIAANSFMIVAAERALLLNPPSGLIVLNLILILCLEFKYGPQRLQLVEGYL